jgi:L-rhamnono-1,4-lactonase
MGKAMKLAHEGVSEDQKVIFILNHFCKPAFASDGESFDRWQAAVAAASKLARTYMKLSGAFSELPPGLGTVGDVASKMKPWYEHVFASFGPRRIMFGSDWPVCNLAGPRKESSWGAWKEVVDLILEEQKGSVPESDREWVWRNTAAEAYRLNAH